MICYTNSGAALQQNQNFLLQIPTNMLLGEIHLDSTLTETTVFEIQKFLKTSYVTLTLVDNYRSVQEVLATKLPLSFFNDMSSLGEGSVAHVVGADYVKIMFKIPVAFSGALDLNSDKYIKVEFSFSKFGDSVTTSSVKCYARQSKVLTNECIQYKRLNIPDGVLTYEFKPTGSAYILDLFGNGDNTSNIDFVELESMSGYKSRLDFYELFASYYEQNEISSRFLFSDDSGVRDVDAEGFTIGVLDTIGVDTIKIVRNDTTTDTTIVVVEKLVTKASDNAVTNGSVVKLENGTYVSNNKTAVNNAVLETIFVPQKQYAVANTIKQMASSGSTFGRSFDKKPSFSGVLEFMK